MTKLLRNRFGGIAIFYLLFIGIATGTRLALLLQAWAQLSLNPFKLLGAFLCGLIFDLAAASYASLPLLVILLLLPRRWLQHRRHRFTSLALFAGIIYLLLFGAVAEWFFWDEFSSRFNFIAVDYLIYTTEVIGNIRESYPLPAILIGLAVATGLLLGALWKAGWLAAGFAPESPENFSRRPVLLWLALPLLAHFTLSSRLVPEFGNSYNQELARNGLYSLFAAFWENELSYDKFYPTIEREVALARVRQSLAPEAAPAPPESVGIRHRVAASQPEQHWNVIQITVESLSASFLGCFGNPNHLTPNLDRLYQESLVFTNFYATGTRTVRGMEALTLCVPPTPGQSIVRRPNNANLFTTGALFRSRDYDTAFIYSGYGYFDNMNAYFAGNGYRVVDRNTVAKEDITYATVWGACDEDLFRWTLRGADAAFAAGQPFHHFVMTTSNHRPFGFPAGKIDLPTGHRDGAVKYTDYAIGQFLAAAAAKPWFSNTLFIVVGDHCASAAGKTALPIPGYHVPAFVWNPGLVPPRIVDTLCSQIDLLPTVFGLMHWSYESQFFGRDILAEPPPQPRAFISTYQRLGYLTPDRLAILEPVRREEMLTLPHLGASPHSAVPDQDFLATAISQYQIASYLFTHGLNRAPNAK